MDRYSRFIALMRVVLPLAALAILSTLFLLSRNTDLTAELPFAEAEIRERTRDRAVSDVLFSTVTGDGDEVTVSAATFAASRTNINQSDATELWAQIDLTNETRITMSSDTGIINLLDRAVDLNGNVQIITSTGYDIRSDAVNGVFANGTRFETPGPVQAKLPMGTLDAGNLRFEALNGPNSAQFVFTNGVKLIYDPKDR